MFKICHKHFAAKHITINCKNKSDPAGYKINQKNLAKKKDKKTGEHKKWENIRQKKKKVKTGNGKSAKKTRQK